MKLEARFKEVRLRKGLAESTEEAYWMWAKDFINRKSTVEGVGKTEITEDWMGVKKGDLSFRHSITIGNSVVSLVGIETNRVRVRVESDDLISFVPVDDVAKTEAKRDTDAVTT